jgi:hypothetical protein
MSANLPSGTESNNNTLDIHKYRGIEAFQAFSIFMDHHIDNLDGQPTRVCVCCTSSQDGAFILQMAYHASRMLLRNGSKRQAYCRTDWMMDT